MEVTRGLRAHMPRVSDRVGSIRRTAYSVTEMTTTRCRVAARIAGAIRGRLRGTRGALSNQRSPKKRIAPRCARHALSAPEIALAALFLEKMQQHRGAHRPTPPDIDAVVSQSPITIDVGRVTLPRITILAAAGRGSTGRLECVELNLRSVVVLSILGLQVRGLCSHC